MLKKSLFVAVVVLSLVFLSQNCLALSPPAEEDNDSGNGKLIAFLLFIYVVLFAGIFGYFFELDKGVRQIFHSDKVKEDKELGNPEINQLRILKDGEDFNNPKVHECSECKKQFVSTALKENVKCPWCKVKDQVL